jgi:CheY-like chemotaxis protein
VESGHLLLAAHLENGSLHLRIMADPAPALDRPQVQDRIAPLEQMLTSQNAGLVALEAGNKLLGFELRLPTDRQTTVLVVDDNEDMLALYERYLVSNQYQIIRAETAEDAIDLALRTQPSIVILDLMMPDQDGWEVLKSLRINADTRHIPIVICSVLKQRELALTLGAQAFIEKPITESGLLATLSALEI